MREGSGRGIVLRVFLPKPEESAKIENCGRSKPSQAPLCRDPGRGLFFSRWGCWIRHDMTHIVLSGTQYIAQLPSGHDLTQEFSL